MVPVGTRYAKDGFPPLEERPDCPRCGAKPRIREAHGGGNRYRYICPDCNQSWYSSPAPTATSGEEWGEYLRGKNAAKGRGNKVTLECPVCLRSFVRYASTIRRSVKQGKKVCCSRECAGRIRGGNELVRRNA